VFISVLIVLIAIYFHFVLKNKSMYSATVTTNGGIQMPRLIYGTAWKKEATTQLVIKAVLSGFRGIDTACQPKHYR
jgi:hypothetical protein